MKLAQLYTNRDDIFVPITFRQGINVIMGKVLARDDSSKDSHNLGKSLLIDVIDFCLLVEVKRDFFLKKHVDRFAGMVFFLEVELPAGGWVTIRRTVDEMTKISFKKHTTVGQNLRDTPEEEWDHWRVPFERSVELLDSFLSLVAIGKYQFRKGHTYFLRKQQDFNQVFTLSKFALGKDRDWKPFVAQLLGLDAKVLHAKYLLDEKVGELTQEQTRQRRESGVTEADYDRLKGQIDVKEDEIAHRQTELDQFDMHAAEIGIARETADSVDAQIGDLNDALYNMRSDLEQARRSQTIEVGFDMDRIKQIFEEANICFPDQLRSNYDSLLDFNRKIHAERHATLTSRIASLEAEITGLEQEHRQLSDRRTQLLSALRTGTSMEKFKRLQKTLDQERANLELLREKMTRVGKLLEVGKNITALKKEQTNAKTKITEMVLGESARYREIRLEFARIVREVLDRSAEIWTTQNGEGNLELHAEYSQADGGSHTSEGEGFTYRKFLCMAFDLALLSVYAKEPFYHFVYHDGALETLDPRRKLRWLDTVRRICEEKGIQYILSLIEGDLPRDAADNPVEFAASEVILSLHDRDDSGRLFKMPPF